MIREFEIAVDRGLVPIPIGVTGYAAKTLFDEVLASPKVFYGSTPWLLPLIKDLGNTALSHPDLVSQLIKILQRLNK